MFLCFVGSVFCAEYVWTGTESINWVEAESWKAEDKVVIDNNQTYTISSNCSVGELVLNVGSKLIISEGVTVNIGYLSIYGELTNNGTIEKIDGKNNHIVIASNASLINAGTISQNSLEMNSGSTMQNLTNSTITFGAVNIQIGAVLDNLGDMIIEGRSTNTGTIKNSGSLDLKGPLENNSNGILENNGEIESLSGITNQSGGSITNNSSGTITGNINNTGSLENSGGITGAITNNAGGTVTDSGTISGDVSGDGTYEDNHIVVKTYSTISSVTVLDWNKPTSWENRVKPDISGNTAVKIELNANISAETLAFNSSGSNKIELFLNGNTLTVENIYLESNIDHTDKNYGNLHIYGDGAVKITTFDTSNNSADTVPHKMFLYNGAEIYVTTNLYPDQSKVEITDSSKNCKFYLTASGANVNYGESGINYIDINPEPYGEPQIYKVIDMGGNPFSVTGKEIKFYTEKDTSDTNIQPINFQYSVEILGENQNWTLDGTSLSPTTDFSNLPVVTILPTEVEKILVLQCSTSLESLAVGEGIIITIKTPDGTMDLAEIRCLKSEILWTGKQDTNFSDPANWTIDGEDLDDIAELENQAVVIPSGCENYPVLEEEITVKKISIKTNASLTVSSNGKLTTEKLELTGTGKILASAGTVKFINSGDNPSYSSETPYLSTFGTIEVVSGTFNLNYPLTLTQLNIDSGAKFLTTNELIISSIENSGDFSTTADLHIKKSLTNNGTFQAGKVYLEPSVKNIIITGNSGDTEEIANNTKITELYCENQADKNLVINNGISVEKIALSGNENVSGQRLTVKYDKDNYSSGIVYLENNYDEAKYLFLADNSLVTIKNATITVYESDTQHILATNFVEKGWRLGDPKKFIWVGKNNDWNNPANWDYGTVPTPGKPVEIPTGLTNYPVLESDINLIDETALTKEDSLKIESGAKINFAGQKVSVTNFENLGEVEFNGGSIFSTSIKNSGTVILTGKEEISGEISELGTVIYSGTEADAKFSWGSNYKKLEIQDGFSGSFENGVIVSDSLKIENGVEITENQDNTKNLVEISDNGTLSNTDTIEITSTGSQSFNGKINLSKILNITSDDKLTIATQSDFTNAGTIKAVGVEIDATGDFRNEGKIDSSNADIRIESASFTNGAQKEISAKKMSIESGTVINAGILTTTGDFLVNATGDFTSQGKVEVGSELNIKSQKCTLENEISAGNIIFEVSNFESFGKINSTENFKLTAKSIIISGTIEAQNGEFVNTVAEIVFEENSKSTFSAGFDVTTATDFENKGTIEVTSGNFSANVKNNFANNSQSTVTAGKLLVNPVINFTNAGTIKAVGVEINATGIFTNEGTITSKDMSINSPTVNLAGTIDAETDISISGNLYIVGKSSISFGENFVIGTDLKPKDVYISALDSNNEASTVKFIPNNEIAKIQIYGNFALFNGDVSLGTELVVGKDMILLNGKTSGENSIYKDSMTVFDLFKYHLDNRPVSCNLETFPTENPINNAQISHEEYKSTLTLADNLTISVGKNFYSNGVDLGTNTTGSWYLKFLANDVATSSFAECYNATIKNCNVFANTTPGEAWLATENCNDGTGNTNVAFSKAIFANVATISDNIIRVSFVDGNSDEEKPEIKIENSCNEISAWLENFRFNVSGKISPENPDGIKFSGVYANPECTDSTDGKGDLSTFYLKYEIPTDGSIDYRWNTDATGSDPGAEESTDTSGVHKNIVPNLAFKRAIEASYAGLRDEHKNRLVSVGTGTAGSEPLFEATKDEAPPVLVAVTLGQEQHETVAASQHHYDSHNFIEWQFSEPVEITYNSVSQGGFGTSTGTELVSNAENIQTTENFGKITNANNGFSVAGLGSFQNGKVTVGSKTGSGEVNVFYRNFALEAGKTATAQEFRIRLSIAGYVDEGNPVTVNGVDYKNWLGFIDSKNTTIPSGTFTMKDSAFLSIKDKSENKNPLVPTKNQPVTVNAMLFAMNEDSKRKTLYGTWDIDPPVVANYMKEDSSNIYAQELIAVNNTSGEIAESLELHFLDNSVYNKYEGKENLQWRTKIGWIENNVHLPQNIPLDIRGGSRMVSTENQTYGGVRFSTLVDVLDSFVCKNLTTGENIVLNELSQSTTNEVLFGESDENQFDVPYLTLKFENAKGSLLKHNFELEYNKNSQKTAFITDLAGNLLYEFSVKSPDKNPPQFLLSIGGVNHDKLYILFSKPIDYLNQNNEPDEGKLRRIVKSLSIFESSSDGKKDTELISYKLGSQAKVVTETKESTGIEISLTRSVSYDELKNLYIGVNSFDSGIEDEDGDSSQRDPITGETGKYSMLYDMFENPISEDSKHCFSDFAVNAFDVLYAYDGRAIEDAALNQGVFGGNQWTVTDFSGEINNSSKVIAGKDITIAGKIVDFSDNPDNQDKFSMLADISPSKNKPDLDFTDYSGINTRLWFSNFVKYFPVNNSITSNNYTTDNLLDNGKIETSISGNDNQSFTYVIPNDKEDSKSVNWHDGDEFEFLFKVLDSNNEVIMVDGNVDGDTDDEVDHPLFALRLKDENDITSIDLWSLHVVELLRQKGGATILNNVINSLNNEETAIEIQVPQTGFLTVQVLTLDGNVVKVLQKGRVEEGTYYYKWNGTNNSGAAVARGMYFIRVVGPKIDETRKVMVIKE